MRYEGIGSHELLGSGAAREHAHRAACWLVGKGAHHEQPPVRVKRVPQGAMRLDVRRNLRPEVWRGLVEQDVFHGSYSVAEKIHAAPDRSDSFHAPSGRGRTPPGD